MSERKGTYCPFCQGYNTEWRNRQLQATKIGTLVKYDCGTCEQSYYISVEDFDLIGDEHTYEFSYHEPSKVLDKINKKMTTIADLLKIITSQEKVEK